MQDVSEWNGMWRGSEGVWKCLYFLSLSKERDFREWTVEDIISQSEGCDKEEIQSVLEYKKKNQGDEEAVGLLGSCGCVKQNLLFQGDLSRKARNVRQGVRDLTAYTEIN